MDVLIVEKETSFEYLENKQGLENIDSNVLDLIEQKHEKHYEIRQRVIAFLNENNLSFKIIKDFEIKKEFYDSIDFLITLGGDGVFLHGIKHLKNQPVIGVNTDVEGSVGFLTMHTEFSVEDAISSVLNNSFKFDSWNRLSAKIDGKKLDYVALNEIVISVPELYKTSHVTIKQNGRTSKSRGNGVVIATSKGSNAFYKSAGGIPFKKNDLGFVLVLPYSVFGTFEKNQESFSKDQSITIIPNRQHHNLIFDCDEQRKVELKQESIINIFIDESDALKVIL